MRKKTTRNSMGINPTIQNRKSKMVEEEYALRKG